MATAAELDLKTGDVVQIGINHYDIIDGGLIGTGLDMTQGSRVEVLDRKEWTTDVRYLDDVVEMRRDKKTGETSMHFTQKAGFVSSIWQGYVGYIPESLQRENRNSSVF